MKTAILSAILALSASSAFAAPVLCTTNVTHNPRLGSTDVMIKGSSRGTTVTQRTQGGMAHFVTAPKTFAVSVAHEGPEVVIYTNKEEGFELTVNYQPMGGEIRGTLITEALSGRINEPVVCTMALN